MKDIHQLISHFSGVSWEALAVTPRPTRSTAPLREGETHFGTLYNVHYSQVDVENMMISYHAPLVNNNAEYTTMELIANRLVKHHNNDNVTMTASFPQLVRLQVASQVC